MKDLWSCISYLRRDLCKHNHIEYGLFVGEKWDKSRSESNIKMAYVNNGYPVIKKESEQ